LISWFSFSYFRHTHAPRTLTAIHPPKIQRLLTGTRSRRTPALPQGASLSGLSTPPGTSSTALAPNPWICSLHQRGSFPLACCLNCPLSFFHPFPFTSRSHIFSRMSIVSKQILVFHQLQEGSHVGVWLGLRIRSRLLFSVDVGACCVSVGAMAASCCRWLQGGLAIKT